jgi:hypothetical protein
MTLSQVTAPVGLLFFVAWGVVMNGCSGPTNGPRPVPVVFAHPAAGKSWLNTQYSHLPASWRMLNGKGYKLLYSFRSSADGARPSGLVGANGYLYGTTYSGGISSGQLPG